MRFPKLLLSILVLSAALCATAQQPEPIYSFARVSYPVSWYKTQNTLWEKEIKKDPSNAFAWYNYYRVNRNLSRVDTTDKRSQEEKSNWQKKIVADMGKAVPNSFEYNLCQWMISGNDYSQLSYLKKAAELGPDRREIFSEMINWGEIEGNTTRRDEYAKKWYESGEASTGMLYYNYNVLAGLKENAILITCGDNDTYPIWLLQAAKGVRKDVTVLNTSLLYISDYRKMIFKKLGIKDLGYDMITDTTLSWDDAQKKHQEDLLKAIIGNSGKRPVYIGLTVSLDHYKFVEDKLYLTGLAYEYSNTTLDNMGLMRRNFEQRYALDYIDRFFAKDISEDIVKNLNANYLVPMLKLYDHYKESGDQQHEEWVRQKVTALAKGRPEEKEVNKYLDKQ